VKRTSSDVVSIEEHINLVVASIGSLVGNIVSSISLIFELNIADWSRGSGNIDLNIFASEGLVLSALVDSSNAELKVLDESVSRPCSRLDIHVVGGSLDRSSVESNGHVVTTGILGLVLAVVSTIAVINNIARDRSARSVDFNDERIASFLHVVSVLVLGLDGEGSREGIEVSWVKTRSEGQALRGISSRFNVDDLGGSLDVIEVNWVGRVSGNNSDVVISRIGRLVLNSPGTIVVILNLRNDQFGVRIFNDDIEEISSSFLGGSISKSSVDGEDLRVSGFVTIFETRSISPALVGAGELHRLFNVNLVGCLGNVGSTKGDSDEVLSRVDWVVGTSVRTLLLS